MTLDRAEAVLTDPSLTNEVDTVLRRTGHGYRAAAARGSVDFIRHADDSIEVLATEGVNPLGDERAVQRVTVADETGDDTARNHQAG